jgi:hypothetical protein
LKVKVESLFGSKTESKDVLSGWTEVVFEKEQKKLWSCLKGKDETDC